MLEQLLSLFRREAPEAQEKTPEQLQHEKLTAFHEQQTREETLGKNKPKNS